MMHCRHQRQRQNQNHQRDDHDEHHHKLWLQHQIVILGQDPKTAATAALVKPNYYSSHHRPIAEEVEESDANFLLDGLRSSSSHGSLSLRSLTSSSTSTRLCSTSFVRSLSHNCNNNSNNNMSYFTKHYNNNNNSNSNNKNNNLANDTFRILNPSKVQVTANNNNNNIFNRMVELDSSGLGPYALATTSTDAATKNVVRNSNSNNNNNMNLLSTLRGDAVAVSAASSSSGSSSNNNNTNYGPSLLFRLIAIPPPNEPLPWDIILQRAKSHPHEACVYDSNAGGHVYALHRLLRRTGNHSTSGSSGSGSGSGGRCCYRPPLSVVEAVMQACPRAVTRKQAMIDEDELLLLLDDDKLASLTNTTIHTDDDNNNSMIWKSASSSSGPPPNDAQLLNFVEGATLPLLPPNNNNNNNNNDNNAGMHPRIHINNGQQQQQHNHPPHQGRDNTTIGYRHRPSGGDDTAADHDDVRYEYPLAIACEYEQSGEIIRLLASSISKTKPAYRSEVFRSLDFVSLPNSMVRILLEEYAGCVLERGVNSEATEGDDDDCPLEQVLFWWDDPDMVGIEEAILKYPNCSMKNDLWNLWEKLSMMLYAASTGTMKGYDESKESFKVLHHVLRIASDGGIQDVRFPNDVTHALLLLAKFIQRELISMFRERDESGSFPIHIAVSGSGLFRQNSNDSHYMDSAGWNGEMVDEGNDQESVRQNRNNADEEREVDGDVFQAHGGEAADAGVGAHALNGEQQQHGPPAVVQRQEEDGEGEEEDEEDDNDEEGDDDDDDIDTSTGSMDIIRLLLDQYPASIRLRDSQSGSLPVHLALQHNPYATNVIEHLLDRFPRSAMMPDGNGRLAIHLALIHKSPTWKMILSLSPAALEARDPVTGLLPFQLAAMAKPVSQDVVTQEVNKDSNEKSEHDLLSTCFYLLRMSPCLASGLADIEPPRRSSIQQQIMFRCKPRVTKLEEENERLRRRVDELELKLRLMEMGESSTTTTTTCPHHVKKRKSSLREY